MDALQRRSEEKIAKAREEREKLHRIRNLQFELRQQELKQNQLHMARRMQMKQAEIKMKIDRETDRVQKMNQDKAQLALEREQRILKLKAEKEEVSQEMVEFAIRNKVNLQSVDKLAAKYGIDIQGMKAKYQKQSLPSLKQ
jgi:hypothetical protein